MGDKHIPAPHTDLTYQIIGCAMAVHRERGPGYREDTYQRELAVQFTQRGLAYEPQKLIPIYDSAHQDVLVGYYIPDFVVSGQVIVEIKALPGLENGHIAQIIGYLAATECPVGLLINFGARSLQYRRILPPTKFLDHHLNRQWLFVPDWLKAERQGADDAAPSTKAELSTD